VRQPGDDNEPPPHGDEHAPGNGHQGRNGSQARQERQPQPTAMGATWRSLELRMLAEHPPLRSWLLRRPTRDGKPAQPGSGDGLLPLGKVGLLVSDGGVGKTMALVALAISVITGRSWLEHYYVPMDARDGKVVLILGEEDADEVHRRLYAVTQAYELSEAERERVVQQLVVLPLSGHQVALVTADGVASRELVELRRRLQDEAGPNGWSLIVLDPFSRFAGPEAEVDNAAATQTIQLMESLVNAPGSPTVLIAHHAPQVSISGGGTVRARGVTGIRDAVRWEATLRADGRDVFFRQSKSNYSVPMHEELRLVRGPGGLLRVATEAEEEARDERRKGAKEERHAELTAKQEARIAYLQGVLLEKVASAEKPPTSQKQLVGLLSGRKEEREAAISRLLASGRIQAPTKDVPGYRVAQPKGQMDLDMPKQPKDEPGDDEPQHE
jgi:hypothetical protein